MESNFRMNVMGEDNSLMGAVMGGVRIMITASEPPKLNPAEKDLAEALLFIAGKHGTFDESGCGIYAAYDPAITNETQNIGVKCSNCVLYAGMNKCKIISFPVEPDGKCRFAVIPDGVVAGYSK